MPAQEIALAEVRGFHQERKQAYISMSVLGQLDVSDNKVIISSLCASSDGGGSSSFLLAQAQYGVNIIELFRTS